MTRLALLRHGHTEWNRAGRIQGRTDIPLDDAARTQLSALHLPSPWDRAQVWSSPLARARETAELVTGRPPRAEPALMEMDWGQWEGQHSQHLHDDPASGFRHIEDWGWDFAPPAGEGVAQVRDRLRSWAAGLSDDNLAVCHIGIMRVALALATGWHFSGPPPFQIKRNRLYVLDLEGPVWRWNGDAIRLPEHAP